MIWLIGCRGMLGTELAGMLDRQQRPFVGTDIECDITNPAALRDFAARQTPDWIVNASAYTNVDRAEDEEPGARAINAEGAGRIADVAAARGARMIHISTDYVFDGRATRPYLEDDPIRPLGAYGRTKAAGEALVRAACPDHVILRTAWLYGRHGRNFVATMLKLMTERATLKVVSDQRGTPTWTRTLADVIMRVIANGSVPPGTYHVTDEGETTWHGFAVEIQRVAVARGLIPGGCEILPIPASQYPSKAPRPAYSVLSKARIQTALGFQLPDWRSSLASYADELAAQGQSIVNSQQ